MFPLKDDVPRRRAPLAMRTLVLANLVVFLFELSCRETELRRLFYEAGIVPARFVHPRWAAQAGFAPGGWWAFLTSLFLHAGWIHVLGNMWVLWIFGDNVEDRMGRGRFVVFYLLCGVLAGVADVAAGPDSTVPVLGASGAIAGVLGAYVVMFPRARVITLIPIFFYPLFVELPAVTFIVFWFLLQLLSGALALTAPQAGTGVAWWAHVGGFLAGLALHRLFLPRRAPR